MPTEAECRTEALAWNGRVEEALIDSNFPAALAAIETARAWTRAAENEHRYQSTHEPTTCTCVFPDPDSVGECSRCRRLALTHEGQNR